MKTYAKLIHRSTLTYLPTKYPSHFYGLPDGKVYFIYARFYSINYDNSGLEYVMAVHKDFSYDYENERLFLGDIKENNNHLYNEMVDKPDPNFTILNVYRNINSYSEAFGILNNYAMKIIQEKESNLCQESILVPE
jgi:hypothetical protein